MKKRKLRAEITKLEKLRSRTISGISYNVIIPDAVTLENGKTYKTPANAEWVLGVCWQELKPRWAKYRGKDLHFRPYVEITYHETKSGRLVLDNLQRLLHLKASDLYYSRLWNDETQHIIYQ